MFIGRGKRVLSVAIAAMMITNLMPVATYAEEMAEPGIEIVSEVTTTEEIAESSESFTVEESEITTEDSESVAETSDETITETESEPETVTSEEETESVEVTAVKEYELSPDEFEEKERLAEVLDYYLSAVEGEDYEAGIVIGMADSMEKAEEIADMYDAELVDFELNVAEYKLPDDMSVVDALMLAADLSSVYPAVYPNIYCKNAVLYSEDITEGEASGEQSGVSLNGNDMAEANDEVLDLESHVADICYFWDPWLYESNTPYQWHHEVIGSQYAWANGIKGAGVKIGLISTGINSHDDIDSSRIKGNYSAVQGEESIYSDYNGMGTCAAGVLIGSHNSILGAGICPEADIYNIRIIEDGSDSMVKGIKRAITSDVDILVITTIFDLPSPLLEEAIEDAYSHGIAVFAPAGASLVDSNYGSRAQGTCDGWPAAYKHVIAVASTDKNNLLAECSNVSKNTELAAPGVMIPTCKYNVSDDGSYYTGAAVATPLVGGEAALILSQKDALKGFHDAKGNLIPKNSARVDALKKIMQASCVAAGAGTGRGIVYLPKALGLATAMTAPSAPVITGVDYVHSGSSYQYVVHIASPDWDTQCILYTLDGKKPSYVNGTQDKFSTRVNDVTANAIIDLSETKKDFVTVNAITVNKLGLASKVVTKKVMLNEKAYYANITAPTNRLTPGKTLKMEAAVIPSNTKTKAFEWHVSYGGNEESAKANGVTVSTAGVVSAKKDAQSGDYQVWAVSKLTPSVISNKFTFTVGTYGIKTIKAKSPKVTEYRDSVSKAITKGELYGMFDAKKNDGTDAAIGELYFTSSNANVVKINSSGTAYVTGPGNATITCYAADSSGVKGSLNMNVIQNAVSILIPSDDYDTVAVGKSLKLKPPTINYNKPAPAVKTVTWSIDAAGEAAGVKVSGGKVITTKNSIPGTYEVTARITNKDGTYAEGKINVRVINNPVTVITMDKSAQVFSRSNSYGSSTYLTLDVKVTGGERVGGQVVKESFEFASSNSNILAVDYCYPDSTDNIKVRLLATGNGVGKVNVTVAAKDGSLKKAVCSVNVVNPVSNVKIAPAKAGGTDCVCAGKSLPLKATIATEYGKTTNAKVNWYLKAGDEAYASISRTGVVTAKPTAPNNTKITVYADAADGSGAGDAKFIYIYKNVGKMELLDDSGNSMKPAVSIYQPLNGVEFQVKVNNITPFVFGGFKTTSTNGGVATVRYLGYTRNYIEGCCIYRFAAIGTGPGSTKLTVSTRDGSQSVTLSAKVGKKR